ncbi:hypothetical protein HK44_020640 [Pseudomonas fluorescens HK44]|uniref:Phage protein n=1 Tax=Pseudomonas fluorescens HK44 TaxID=1042209 RepID=A0A010SYL6_PSEFL|nr:hypothetical protein [Pseudomonas fluorescens]EXF95798.1 hypothetical protein HK44_020640 [Pseudomonas fluorescens HK44]
MASLTDVLKQVAAQIATIVYPAGTGQPSIAGMPIKVYPGWPIPKTLEADLAAGKVHVSVYAAGRDKKTTRYLGKSWITLSAPVHTVAMTVAGSVVTLSGTVSKQNLLISLNGISYVYAMQPSDTLTTAAAGLASLVPGASSAGPVVTLTGAHSVFTRVGGFGAAIKETKRQAQSVQVTVWASTPNARDLVESAIDSTLSDSNNIAFPDGSVGIIEYSGRLMDDKLQKANLYRMDLFYLIDYATTQTQQAAEVIAPVLNIVNAQSGLPIATLNP